MAKDKVGFEILVEHAKGAKNLKDFVKNLENLDDEQKKSADSAIRAYKGVKKFGDEAGESKNKIAGLKGTVAKLGGVMALIGGVKKGLDISSGLENSRNTLEVVMKDTKKAGDMFEWAVNKANSTPFETDDVVKGAVRLESYGLSAKKMMDQVGDMAAVMDTDLMQAIEAVADAQTGELERLKEYGITKKKIVEQADKMGFKGLINNKGQITDQEKLNEALMELMKINFGGGMERKAKTFSGAISTNIGIAKVAVASFMGMATDGSVGEGSIFDLIRDKAISLSESLMQLMEDGTIEKWGGNVTSSIQGILGLMEALHPVIIGGAVAWGTYKGVLIATTMAGKAQAMWSKLTTAYTIAQSVATGKLSVANGIAAAKQMLLNTAMMANPVGLVIAGVAGLVAGLVLLWKNFDKVKAGAEKAWNMLKKITGLGKSEAGVSIQTEETNSVREKYGLAPIEGSHKNGLANVPHDGYRAELHKGERVLTRTENKNYKTNNGINITININGAKQSIQELADGVMDILVPQLELALKNM